MKSPEMGAKNPEFEALIAHEEARTNHSLRIPQYSRTAKMHKAQFSSREERFQKPELEDKTDLELRTPAELIVELNGLLRRQAQLVDEAGDNVEEKLNPGSEFYSAYNGVAKAAADVPYLTDKIKSGEYKTTGEEKQHIYELLILISREFKKLGIEIPETYTTKTFEEAQLEKEQEETA